MLRVIREQEPSKPSTKLSTAEGLPTLAANRGTEPAKLTKLLRGELDWIVMKALEKDRNRRYETSNGFAADVQRYLADEPVLACPPSAGYRLRKFARRNKGGLAVVALVLFFLVLLGSGIGWAVRDRAAREAEAARQQADREAEAVRQQAARQGKAAGQVESIFAEVDRLEMEQKWPETLALARRAAAAVAGGEADTATAERVRQRLKDLEFIDRLEQIRTETATRTTGTKFDYAREDRVYAQAFRDYGVDIDQLAVEASIDRLKARPALAIPLAAALDQWVTARREVAAAEADWQRLWAVARGIDPEPLRDRFRATSGRPLAEVQDERRRLVESIDVRAHHPATLNLLARARGIQNSDLALRLLRDAQSAYPGDFWLNFTLGEDLSHRGDYEGAVRFYTAAVSLRPNSAAAHTNLGAVLERQKKPDEAIRHYRRAIEIDPRCAVAHSNLGNLLAGQKKWEEAIRHYRTAIEIDPNFATPHNNLGLALAAQNKLDEAAASFKKAIEIDPTFDAPYPNLRIALVSNLDWVDGAIRDLSKAVEPAVSIGLVVALRTFREQRTSEAVAWFRGLAEQNPTVATAHVQFVLLLRHQGKFDEATAACRAAIKAVATNADACNMFGTFLCDGLRDYDGAIECFRTATKLDEKHPHAPRNLRFALTQKGWDLVNRPDPQRRDPRRALEAVQEAVRLDPKWNMAWERLGWVQYRVGDWRAGIESLEKSCKLQPGGTGDFGQWIVMALAHARLAAQEGLTDTERAHHRAEARRLYEQADKQIDSKWRARPGDPFGQATWDFRAEARELMGTKDGKK
jgi:tetratricopeptide (TPR) repeat protein